MICKAVNEIAMFPACAGPPTEYLNSTHLLCGTCLFGAPRIRRK